MAAIFEGLNVAVKPRHAQASFRVRSPYLSPCLAAVTLILFPSWAVGQDQSLAPSQVGPAKNASPDSSNRISPYSTLVSFLDLCERGDFESAARYLRLGRGENRKSVHEGAQLAQDLANVLENDESFDVALMSRDPNGDLADGLPPDKERIAIYRARNQNLEILLQKITRRSGGPAIWTFPSETVAQIPKITQATSDWVLEKYLPEPLVTWKVLGTPVWRWIAFLLVAALVIALSGVIVRLMLTALKPIARRVSATGFIIVEHLATPLRVLLFVALVRAALGWVSPPASVMMYLNRALILLSGLGVAWLLIRISDLILAQLRSRLEVRHQTFSRSGFPLATRILRATILVLAASFVLSAWGYDTTTIAAGLGIGGIAIALAAQKTIENLFGGVAVISDRPVAVGDFCKFGDRVGTVEEIGIRSTRIRTLDRTLVTVPNGEFSGMVLENFSKRDKVWFHPTVSLRRDSTPDQVRAVLHSLENILKHHVKVEIGALPVRFIGIGSYSLDIEIFAYILTSDFDEFLQVQQNLLLQIVDAVTDAGTALALPTQASVSYFQEEEEGETGQQPTRYRFSPASAQPAE